MVLMRAVLAAALAASACAPSLTIVSWEPGKIAPRGARTLVLVDGEGRSGARRIAAQLLVREAKGGWFRVEDRGREGVKLVLVGERASIAGAATPLPDEALWARVDVVQWESARTTVEAEDAEGEVTQVPAQRSDVSLQITIADRSGKVLLREQEYVGTVVVEDTVVPAAVPAGEPLQQAARAAAAAFLGDIAPKQLAQVVRLDDTDGGLSSALDSITKNKWTLAEAEQRLRRYLLKHSHNSIATYDLAVIVDAQGRHEEALPLYDEAMRIHTRDYYIEARAGCARRAAAKNSVFGEPSVMPLEDTAEAEGKPVGEAPPP